ncbi:hypothetical protein KJ865_01115, partial [Myxococcota bacterium]|nr:hypothetical protein [Myxococcota bacterium]
IQQNLPEDIIDRINQMKEWGIPQSVYTYLLRKNLYPLLSRLIRELDVPPTMAGKFLGQKLKHTEGHYQSADRFDFKTIFDMFAFLKEQDIKFELAFDMIAEFYSHPKMDFQSVLDSIRFKKLPADAILDQIHFYQTKFVNIGRKQDNKTRKLWIMGQLRKAATGNIDLSELASKINA